jgi:hypothetical protein
MAPDTPEAQIFYFVATMQNWQPTRALILEWRRLLDATAEIAKGYTATKA